MKNQLNLFDGVIKYGSHLKHPIKPYYQLNINERINAKADMAGFQSILLETLLPWNDKNDICWMRDVCYWMLSEKWYWHNSHNKNSIETILWRKSKLFTQNKIALK